MKRTLLLLITAMLAAPAQAVEAPPALRQFEERRIEVIQRASASTVAIFEQSGGNGGSGVVISDDGLVITNFHVTSPCGPTMLVGASDGTLHEAVLLGVDPTGDIALVQLRGDHHPPAAEIGDSDLVRIGDEAIVIGNPLLLAEDFSPSVSVGVISGTHRYQYPSGSVLEYADCLQTDAAINPGNSGGPLFDGQGRLIGINGRGSFEKRGRVNVGVGYAVSINQVMRFVSHLRTGRIVDHASLGATVVTRSGPRAIVDAIETTSDAYRRGLRPGDELLALGSRETPTANALLNALGVLPSGWRTTIEYRRGGRRHQAPVRLGPLHAPGELEEAVAAATPDTQPPVENLPNSLFEEREGYANYAAQRREKVALLALCDDISDNKTALRASYRRQNPSEAVEISIGSDHATWLAPSGEFRCDPQSDLTLQAAPPRAPALLGALWVWRTLAAGQAELLDSTTAIGQLPFDPDGRCYPVLAVTHRGLQVEFYLDFEDRKPIGLAAWRDESEDAVWVEFLGTEDQILPEQLLITIGDRLFSDLRMDPSAAREENP